MTDEMIIALYLNRDEQAIQESMLTYGSYCRTVAMGILNDPADAEEAVADTWLKAWDSIPLHRPKYLRLFLGRLTRNAAVSIWRRNNARCRGGGQTAQALEELGSCIGQQADPQETVDQKELTKAITAFLKTEPAVRRGVFLRRYFYLEELPSIAQRYGLQESNVRMMLTRTRQRLKKYLKQEGYEV